MKVHDAPPLVRVQDALMEFPGVVALDNVNFELRPGECHALVGENGAGKSTLAKCIIGENRMTAGGLEVNGERVDISGYDVRQSQANGIAVVHQEFQLVDELSGLENIFLGHYAKKGPFIDQQAQQKRADELLDFLQMKVNLKVPVRTLRTAEKQVIQLARALALEANIVILDELTAVLPESDIEEVFRIVKLLKKRGIGIIYISHRLEEIFEICDRYTVLRDGQHIGTGEVSELTMPRLVNLIAGRELSQVYPDHSIPSNEVLLEISDFTSDAFKDISLKIHAGEVVGIAGLVGAGKTELLQAIFGAYPRRSGSVRWDGKPVSIKRPRQAINLGIGLVPDERKNLGLNMLMDIWQNATLAALPRFSGVGGLMDEKAERGTSTDVLDSLNLAYSSLWQGVGKLSGGNQQKIVIAKWLIAQSRLFLMDEPTRGIDVGAKFEVYRLISELTAAGKSVLLVSPEVEELLGLANRVYVMYEGKITDVVEGDRRNQEEIMTGVLGVAEE